VRAAVMVCLDGYRGCTVTTHDFLEGVEGELRAMGIAASYQAVNLEVSYFNLERVNDNGIWALRIPTDDVAVEYDL
jgi:hypothetical protein